ncbi:agmatinase [Leptobacterium flavescens]|uniref:Agmatinase n=1 Tax=Leptobacterium flavescens TaxID=472055 RepID=A0A6P0UQD1_9FLAO|nr:agmatinase [Leptobacterium flavescens]NER15325.1 agmatinase [Leptobacterium flavescens]
MNKISVLGVLYDQKSSFLKGPALAPPLIRNYLHNGASNLYAENGMDIGNASMIVDAGDFSTENYAEIEAKALELISEESKLFTLGGDHSISYPIIKAHHAVHSESFDILHIDAHSDLYDQYEGDGFSHACPFARVMEGKLAERLVQVGIRTLNQHQKEQAEKFGVEIIQMKEYELSAIPKFERPIYLSLDMDAIDPAFAPGVSHHEPGGFTSREVIQIIQQIDVPIIGADLVEYNPIRDINGITGALAAKLMKEILSKMLS